MIFLDLDGVLADFDGHFMPTFGCDHLTMEAREMWEHIDDHGNYFRELPPCTGAIEFYREVEGLWPVILTALPRTGFESVARQKREWVREHLGNGVIVLPVQSGTKPLFMQHPGDILIDDWVKNTTAWELAGGRAILHRTFPDTREALRRMLHAKHHPHAEIA